MVRLNSDGTIDSSINLNNLFTGEITDIQRLILLEDGKILSQMVVHSFDWDTDFFFTLRLNSNWTLDTTFYIHSGCALFPMLLQSDGKIIMKQTCIDWSAGLPSYNILFRLNNDGSNDLTLSAVSVNNEIGFGMGLQPDNKILIAGGFTVANGFLANHIGRIHPNGILDQTFDGGTGPNIVNTFTHVDQIITQPDGKILITGFFSNYNGLPRNSIARLNNATLSANAFETKTFMTYPNPVTDILHIKMPDGMDAKELEIIDLVGKKVTVNTIVSNQINVSNLNHGLYLLRIKTDKQIFTSKFLRN